MNELSLFTGIGGGLLGTKLLGWNHIGYVEWDKYCCKVLEQRIKDGILDDSPIWNLDIREFNRRYAEKYRGLVDVITAGFPCQPFSVAGKRAGADDERNMWPAAIECIHLVRPRYALLENVPGLLTSGYFGTILRDLAESGYDCRWRCLSAAEVGASHLRDRLFIVAYTGKFPRFDRNVESQNGKNTNFWRENKEKWGLNRVKSEMGTEALSRLGEKWRKGDGNPPLPRILDGIPNQLDRLKGIGNAQVPAVVATVWKLLTENV